MTHQDTYSDRGVSHSPSPSADLDDRLAATIKVWRAAFPLLVISVPFVLIFKMVLLPMLVVTGIMFTSAAIWMFGERDSGASRREKVLAARVAELEKRLENVETISRVERQIASREQSGSGPANP